MLIIFSVIVVVVFFVSPAKHGRHIGSMSLSASSSPASHTVGFRSITFEGVHQFHTNFTEGSSIIKYRSS